MIDEWSAVHAAGTGARNGGEGEQAGEQADGTDDRRHMPEIVRRGPSRKAYKTFLDGLPAKT